MPANRVTRASTRAARATAANLPAPLANPPAPIPITEGANAPQTAPAGGPSPRKTRSGKILGMVRTVATKLTRVRRAPKTAPSQEVAGGAEDDIHVVPTTDAATIPQPPAPSRTRGGKAAKVDENEVQTAAKETAASSSNAETAPAPAPTQRTIKRTKSTRSEPSNRKGKARELPKEDAEAPQPTVDTVPAPIPAPVPAPVPTVPSSPRSPKSIEDIERVTADLHTLNATLLSNEQIQWVEHTYESHFFEDSTLDYVNVPKAAVRVLRQWRDQAQQPPHNNANGGLSQATAPISARDQGKQNGHPPPPVASSSRAPAPSNPEPEPVFKPGMLKREHAVNWGYPEYYKERLRKAQEAGGSATAAELDYPKDQWPSATSSSSTVPSQAASTSRPIAPTGAAPSGNGNGNAAGASGAAPPPARLQRWNAVILGYPEGYTPRNPWPASAIDPTGLTAHPDVVRDESGVLVVPPHVFSSSRVPPVARTAPPQPRTAASPSVPVVSRSPPPSSSSNESADLDEVEASITIDLEEGDAHPAADLLVPAAQPSVASAPPPPPPAFTSTPARSRPAPLTRQYAAFFDSNGREVPPHHEEEEAVVQEVIAHVLREVEAERAARPAPSTSSSVPRVPITRTEAPAPAPARPGGSSGMSLFAPAGNAKGKGRATAPTTTTTPSTTASTSTRTNGGAAAAKTNARPVGSLFGPKPDKGKKRAREPEPEPEPACESGLKLWGYASSTGPMKVRVELVPVVPSPKRQRVSEAGDDVAVAPAAAAEAPAAPIEAPTVPVEAPAVVDVPDESATAPSEDQTSPTATQQGAAKRSREEFEEGSSVSSTHGDQEEGEGETRPVKKLRTRPQ